MISATAARRGSGDHRSGYEATKLGWCIAERRFPCGRSMVSTPTVRCETKQGTHGWQETLSRAGASSGFGGVLETEEARWSRALRVAVSTAGLLAGERAHLARRRTWWWSAGWDACGSRRGGRLQLLRGRGKVTQASSSGELGLAATPSVGEMTSLRSRPRPGGLQRRGSQRRYSVVVITWDSDLCSVPHRSVHIDSQNPGSSPGSALPFVVFLFALAIPRLQYWPLQEIRSTANTRAVDSRIRGN